MATAKALMINNAYRYDWTQGGSNGDITRFVQGWGTAQVQNLYERAPKTIIVDENDPILPLGTKTYPVNVAAGESSLNVTLVYTDPMGTVGAAHQRINDLSLKVTSPSSTFYWGNNGLQSGNGSTAGGNSNTIDTVENVFIPNPESGAWIVEVIADEVVQDSHLETPQTDADFALVISGVTEAGNLPPNTPSSPAPADGAVAVPVDDDLGWNGGDPNSGDSVNYDVYFGTDPNPPFVGRIGPYPATQTAITYDPGTLANNTLYHWKIIAEDDQSGLTAGPVWSFTTVELNVPPATPSNPDPADGAVDVSAGADLGWDGGDPNTGDTVTYDIYLGTTNPPAYFDTTPSYSSSQTAITYDPGALSSDTPYYWQIVARDGSAATATGPVWSFTTGALQPENYYAAQDITVSNGGLTGDYTRTFSSDDSYEGITEKASVRSSLEHKWTIDVPGGLSAYVFSVEAHHTVNSEGDDFVFAYSTDNVTFVDMLTVTKTADDDTPQVHLLPASLSGTIYIRAKDTDRTKLNRFRDTITIDHMFIEGSGTPPPNDPPHTPANPGPADGATGVGVNDDLTWTGGDPNAIDTVTYDVHLGTTNPPAYHGSTPSYSATQTAIGYDPGTLAAQTQYYWQIVAQDNGGLSATGPVWSFATGQETLIFYAGQDIAVSNSRISGSYGDTFASDDVYEGITERVSNKSFLEHKWTILVPGGYASYTFNVEAHHTYNTEGDDFVFAYSTDGAKFMNIVTVTKTSDDDSLQLFSLPASLSGTITIRVLDLNRTKGSKAKDTIFIDRMFIEAGN
jgi:hypothetical protein